LNVNLSGRECLCGSNFIRPIAHSGTFLFFWMLPPKHLFDFMLKNKWKQENLFIQSQKGAKGESWVR
jgi:hypothetical protein